MIVVRQVTEPEPALIPSLCELLIDTVHNGASVGFLAPLASDRAARYWEQVLAALGDGLLLWVAEIVLLSNRGQDDISRKVSFPFFSNFVKMIPQIVSNSVRSMISFFRDNPRVVK